MGVGAPLVGLCRGPQEKYQIRMILCNSSSTTVTQFMEDRCVFNWFPCFLDIWDRSLDVFQIEEWHQMEQPMEKAPCSSVLFQLGLEYKEDNWWNVLRGAVGTGYTWIQRAQHYWPLPTCCLGDQHCHRAILLSFCHWIGWGNLELSHLRVCTLCVASWWCWQETEITKISSFFLKCQLSL